MPHANPMDNLNIDQNRSSLSYVKEVLLATPKWQIIDRRNEHSEREAIKIYRIKNVQRRTLTEV